MVNPTLKTQTPKEALEHFRDFCRCLHDVDEGAANSKEICECRREVDWVNRLGWAWWFLNKLAKELGPDYCKIIECYYHEGQSAESESSNRKRTAKELDE